jgi:DNA-binding beta-propeller fold protein YncE
MGKNWCAVVLFALVGGCSIESPPGPSCAEGTTPGTSVASNVDLTQRAYIVSRDSGDVTVIDLRTLEIAGNFETCGVHNHMAELNADFTKAYVDSAETGETIIFDTRTLSVLKRVRLGEEPTHLSLSKDGRLMAIVNEYSNSVSFLDTSSDQEVKRLGGFYTPHFVRWAPDGKYAYVANIGAHHLSRVALDTLTIDEHIVLDGASGPPNATETSDEDGFADAQIDQKGVLYAAHGRTGRVLVYDTVAKKKITELAAGIQPWIVYAEHPFTQVSRHVVPNFGDLTVSLIHTAPATVAATVGGADRQSFGVNYSSLVPDLAYVMNRLRDEIAVVDTANAKLVKTIAVGGNTETASTTADGKYIVATVSDANRVVIIDAVSGNIVKTFDNVGKYPWSVTIPLGQNYCH